MTPMSLWDKFVKYIELPKDLEGCFELKLSGAHGYPYIEYYLNKKAIKVRGSRASWSIFNGPIPDGMLVLHHCDNRACVRPDHLFVGTQSDNMKDAVRKGRAIIGEKGGQSKLTNGQILTIRREYAVGGKTQSELAREYGVTESTIGRAVRGQGWLHIDGPLTLRGRGFRTDARRRGG